MDESQNISKPKYDTGRRKCPKDDKDIMLNDLNFINPTAAQVDSFLYLLYKFSFKIF